MIKSFRLRLTLFSALLTGLSLAAFGLGTWWLIRDIKIERIDSEVRSHAEREVSRTRSTSEWQGIEARLVSTLGVRDSKELLLLVQNADGETLYRSPHWPAALDTAELPWPNSPTARLGLMSFLDVHAADDSRNAPPGHPPLSKTVSRTVAGQPWRIGLARNDSSRVALAVDAQIIDADMKGIRNAFALALPLTLVLIGIAAWMFSSRALRPIPKLTAAARKVTAEGLDQRLSAQGEDHEFVELIEVFNHMLERLERSFKQAHRFSADAAHELKTPLAILQGQLERAINAAEEGSHMQSDLTSILDEVRRLSTISRKLLLLSQADAGRLIVHREPFDLSKALADLLEDTRMLAPQLQVTGEIVPGLLISADGGLLRQVLHNLISNAIKYNVEGGWVRISTALSVHGVGVLVANSSIGISSDERDKIFERFYRADPARGRHVDGVGLGLSVSREIARAHKGDLSLELGNDSHVTQFLLTLPSSA